MTPWGAPIPAPPGREHGCPASDGPCGSAGVRNLLSVLKGNYAADAALTRLTL